MREEVLVAIIMFLISIGGSIATKNDKKFSVLFLFIASVAGSLAAGMGIRFREIVEGPFGFLDSMLCVFAATLFVFALNKSGAFELLYGKIANIKNDIAKAFAVLFFVALPAMLTGFAGASLLTTGKLVSASLEDKKKASLVVGLGAFLGVLLPPNCIPAMIAANGAGSVLPTPYVGFFLPLLLVALPAFIAVALMNKNLLSSAKAVQGAQQQGAKVSLIVLAILGLVVLVDGLLSSFVYLGGNTMAFFIALVAIIIINKAFGGIKNLYEVISEGISKAIVPIAIVFALGSFIEVSSMTGVRGIFSLYILPYDTRVVMLALMALALVIGYFVSTPIPAFLITYAVFPIGWLANTVIVTGCSVVLAIVALITRKGGIFEESDLSNKEVLKQVWLPSLLVLVMGIIMVVFGDSLSFLIL